MLALKIYIQEQNVQVCGRFINFLAITTPCTIILLERLDCHSYFWTKVPENMRNIRASIWYSVSGQYNGCPTFDLEINNHHWKLI